MLVNAVSMTWQADHTLEVVPMAMLSPSDCLSLQYIQYVNGLQCCVRRYDFKYVTSNSKFKLF